MSDQPFDREQVRSYLQGLVKAPVQRIVIRAITVNPLYHGSSKMTIRLGQVAANLEPQSPPELILAIFESRSFLVVTPSRGNCVGMPYIFTRHEVTAVEREPGIPG